MNVSEPLLVSAADVVRVYGEGEAAVRALDGITVGFPAGRFTAIMGPSGSGKSTLMHILAGLDRPTSGSVVLDGVELVDLDDKRLTNLRRDKVGFVFQSFNLLPVLDARENIVLPMSIAGRKPDEEWLNRLIDTIGLRDRLDPPALRALRRPAAARRRGARARLAAGGHLRRRADRQPRLEGLGRAAGPAAPLGRRVRPDGDHGHPRRGRPPPTPTACSCSATGASSTTAQAATADDVLDLMKAVG